MHSAGPVLLPTAGKPWVAPANLGCFLPVLANMGALLCSSQMGCILPRHSCFPSQTPKIHSGVNTFPILGQEGGLMHVLRWYSCAQGCCCWGRERWGGGSSHWGSPPHPGRIKNFRDLSWAPGFVPHQPCFVARVPRFGLYSAGL